MNQAIFDSQLLSDGHLYCPQEFIQKKNALFKVIVTFEEAEIIESDIERCAIHDVSEDFLNKEELDYYLSLEEL
jgi:hypothetical protein